MDWVSGRAETVQRNGEKGSGAAHVTVLVRDTSYRSRRLILALGVRDILPDIEGLKDAIMSAIGMPEEEQRRRMRALRRRVRDHDVADWSRSFLGDLSSITR